MKYSTKTAPMELIHFNSLQKIFKPSKTILIDDITRRLKNDE